MDEKETPRDDGLNLHDESGMTRRDLMRRGAVVGGTLLWVAPAIQSVGSKAYAQVGVGTPICEACLAVTIDGTTTHVDFISNPDCCRCLDAGGGTLEALILCAISGDCTISGGVEPGPCD